MLASDGIPAGGLFNCQWKLDTSDGRVNSVDATVYPRLPLFTRSGRACTTAFLNPGFWLVFDKLGTWRSMSQLYCSIDEMEVLRLVSSVYDATPVAVRGAFPPVGVVAMISRHLVSYLVCLIAVAPYIGGAAYI